MSEEEVPAGPPAWPGGTGSSDPWGVTGWTSAPPAPGWWPHQYYVYEPPPPRRTSRLLLLGIAVVIFVFTASAAATVVIAMKGLGGPGNTSRVKAAVVDIVTTLGGGAAAAGTGIVLTSSGVVLTNNHVVAGEEAISVRLTATGRTYPATLINADFTHDVAVLQLQGASDLTAAPLGDSATVRVGDSVTALGNALGRGGAPAEARGKVTALAQSITASDESGQNPEYLNGMIQTDAPIEPGDSGGPLINSNGQVIGLDTAASGARRGRESIAIQGFAIPIDTALTYAHQLMAAPLSRFSRASAGGPAVVACRAPRAFIESTLGWTTIVAWRSPSSICSSSMSSQRARN